MTRWIKRWWLSWRGETLDVVSPLSYLGAYERLRTGLIPGSWWGSPQPGPDGYRVVGSMGNRWIRMEAVPSGSRNSYRPVARVRLESLPHGCRLAGKLRIPLAIRVLSAVWLAGCGGAVVVTAGVVGDRLTSGRAAWGDAGIAVAPAVLLVFFLALTSWCFASGRDDTRYLRAWLAERLDLP